MAMEQSFALSSLILDDYFLIRPLDRATVERYKEQKQAGHEFPPVIAWTDSHKNYLLDGRHRYTADQELGRDRILVIFRTFPSRADALMFAAAANVKHGLPLTNAEKQTMVARLLKDPDCGKRSDNFIASNCHMDHKTVAKIRAGLESSGEIPRSDERVGSDGRVIKVKHWTQTGGSMTLFWNQVVRLGLDRMTILDQLVPGARQLDATWPLSKEETWKRLDMLAAARVAEQFPLDSYVRHPAGAMGQVRAARADHILVYDFATGGDNSWMLSGVTRSSKEAFEVWQRARNQSMAAGQAMLDGDDVEPELDGDMTAINAGFDAAMAEVFPPKPTPPPAAEPAQVEPESTPARVPTFADNASVVSRSGKEKRVGRVLRTAWEGLIEKCHVEFPNTDHHGKSRPSYYWYPAAELTASEQSAPAATDIAPVIISTPTANGHTPPTEPTGPKGDTETPVALSTLDNLNPRPWAVTAKTANGYLISDRRGHTVATIESSEAAYFIVRAANAYRQYTSPEAKELEMPWRRINDYFEDGTLDTEQMTEDVYTVMDSLGHVRRALARNMQPEAAATP